MALVAGDIKPDTPRKWAGMAGWLASRQAAAAAVVCLALLGCATRIAAARGELWLDEIWSLTLVAGLTSPDQVFWAVSHDNNHLLNSLWLYLAGPGQAPLLYRVPSIVFGTASIVVAGRLGFRRGRAAGIAAAALVAFGYPFVDYGSEARGYAGLILAILLSLAAFEPAMAARLARRPVAPDRAGWWLGCSIAFGTLSHFTMLADGAVLAMAAALRFRAAGRPPAAVVGETVALFRPTLLLLSPIAVAVAAGVIATGGFTVGGTVPFSWTGFTAGFGGLLRLSAGLPAGTPPGLVMAAAALGLALAVHRRLLDPAETAVGLVAALAIPGLAVIARLPNTEQPRYFLCCVTLLVLLMARALGRCWERGGPARLAAGCLLAVSLSGQIGPLATLVTLGRGQAGALLARMTDDEHRAYATNIAFPVALVLDYHAARGGLPALDPRSDPDSFCRNPPAWYVHAGEASLPTRLQVGPPSCPASYRQAADFPVADLSGRRMRLFRLDRPDASLQ